METFPILHTARLVLRKISTEDIPSLVRYANNPKISDYILNIPYPYQEPDAVFRIGYVMQGFKNKTRYVFAIVRKENSELIGEISLHPDNSKKMAELGYWVGEPFWNKGIATEAIRAVLQFGFRQLDLSMIFATCHVDNEASQKVLLHNGMVQSKGNNIRQYTLDREAYEAQPPE